MKTMLSLRLAVLGAVALFTQTTFAQTWQTVADLRYFGHTTALNAMAKDSFGNLYAAGYGTSNSFYEVALISKSSDGGATWSVADAFASTTNEVTSEYTAMTSDGAGNLYALGDGFDSNSAMRPHWFVRRSQDSGATWTTVLDMPVTGSFLTYAHGIATDAAGNVYVVGPVWAVMKSSDAGNSWDIVDAFNPGRSPYAASVFCHPTLGIFVAGHADAATTVRKTTTYQGYWYVRRSLNGGATWTTVDAYPINAPDTGLARRIVADASGNLYVMGDINGHWITRKSANGGTTWTPSDDFYPRVGTTNYAATPFGLDVDSYGNVIVAGNVSGPGKWQWTVRKLPAGSATWQTVDSFQYVPGRSARANAVVADSLGNVFVGGWGNDATGVNGSQHWLVRKLVP